MSEKITISIECSAERGAEILSTLSGAATAPAQRAPVQTAPAQRAPVQTASAQRAPVQTAPAQRAPVQTAPAQRAPMQRPASAPQPQRAPKRTPQQICDAIIAYLADGATRSLGEIVRSISTAQPTATAAIMSLVTEGHVIDAGNGRYQLAQAAEESESGEPEYPPGDDDYSDD